MHLKNKNRKSISIVNIIINIQATRSAADDKIGIPIAGIFRLAKRRSPPLTPRPANIYGPFCLSSNSIVRAVSPVRDVVVVEGLNEKNK